ncbi:MAG: DNA internalization-related competence protein ComEC/Rec2, partial [Candidatus Competibacteraceae bacterium]|nr:DNA internalization-related competence protein ComEC/Rec2 [Candidatus Competibacteraceae bacterium]
MVQGAMAWLAGVLIFHQLADPPERLWALGLVIVLPLALLPRIRLPALVAAGFFWTLALTDPGFPRQLPTALEGQDLTVVGWVAS